MPQLNPDILREIFDQIVKTDGNFKNVDKFMLAGKEPFHLVLNICKKANSIVICENKIVAKLPGIKYKQPTEPRDDNNHGIEKPAIGTRISTKLKLFKPISIALASSLTSLDIRGFSTAMIPMLKSIKREMREIYFECENLKEIRQACINIPYIQDGVTIKVQNSKTFWNKKKFFTFPCQKLTILDANFSELFDGVKKTANVRKNIRDLTINGRFRKTDLLCDERKEFANFLTSNFPNLENLNVNFSCQSYFGKWNSYDCRIMVDTFQRLPQRIKGCICFKIYYIDIEFPDVQTNDQEYYKIFPITETLNIKLAQNTVITDFDENEFNRFADSSLYYIPSVPTFYTISFKPLPPMFFKHQKRSFKPQRNRFYR